MDSQIPNDDLDAWLASLPAAEWDEGIGAGADEVQEAIAAFEAAGVSSPPTPSIPVPSEASSQDAERGCLSESDDEWFAARPERQCRIRPRAASDPFHHLAEDGAECLTVVRNHNPLQKLDYSVVVVEALGGVVPDDSDSAAFAALKAHRLWRFPPSARARAAMGRA